MNIRITWWTVVWLVIAYVAINILSRWIYEILRAAAVL